MAVLRIPAFPPTPVLMFQADPNDPTWDILRKGEDKLVAGGFQRATEEFQGVSVQILETNEGPVEEIIQLQLGPWRAITTERRAAEILITRFQKQGESIPLAEHPPFRTIQAHCARRQRSGADRVLCRSDQSGRAATQGNFAATTGLAILPAIGADGLLAIGGSVSLATDEYDQVVRAHALIEPPRDGVLKAIA